MLFPIKLRIANTTSKNNDSIRPMNANDHYVVMPPDFDAIRCLGIPKDWRPGVRVAVLDVGLGPGWRMTVKVAVLMMIVLACGAVLGAIRGNLPASLTTSGMIAMVSGGCYGAFFIFCRLTMPETETVIDWKENKVMYRRGRLWKSYPVDQLNDVRVNQKSEAQGIQMSLQLAVGQRQIPLLASDHCSTAETAYKCLGIAANHLATSLDVPLVVPPGIDPASVNIDPRKWSDGYVKMGTTARMMMQSAEMKGNASEAGQHRREAMDYFDIANRIDPSNSSPLLEIAGLSKDRKFSEEALHMAVTNDPDSPEALIQRGRMHGWQGRGHLGKQDHDQAIRLDRRAGTLKARAEFHELHENYVEAIRDFNDAIELADDEDRLESLLDARADCYKHWYYDTEDRHYLDLALADVRQAVAIDPEMNISLCQLLIEVGSYSEAIETLDKMITDDDAYLIGLRGRAYLEQGLDIKLAVRDFTQAIKLEESKPESSDPDWMRMQHQCLSYLYQLRSEAYDKSGDYDKSKRDCERSEQFDLMAH